MSEFEFTDRYAALGIPLPGPWSCHGPCEGTGWFPMHRDSIEPQYREEWEAAEAKNPDPTGWHFMKCRMCSGTGKAAQGEGADS